MKKISSIITIIVMILTTSLLASATEKPVWEKMKIPAGIKEVETAYTMKIVTLANRYNCGVIYFKDGDTEIIAYDNYYRRIRVVDQIHISRGKIVTHSILAYSDKGKIIKYGPTYPVFKEKFLKEIHGLPWKIRKKISDAFPPPKR